MGKSYSLIFMDLNMPVMDGYTVNEIRFIILKASSILKQRMQKGLIKECVIVAVTSYDSDQSEAECFKAGIDKIGNPFYKFHPCSS